MLAFKTEVCESKARVELGFKQTNNSSKSNNNRLLVQKDICGLAVNQYFIPYNFTDSLLFSNRNQNYQYFRGW